MTNTCETRLDFEWRLDRSLYWNGRMIGYVWLKHPPKTDWWVASLCEDDVSAPLTKAEAKRALEIAACAWLVGEHSPRREG